jgi:predicted RNA binding protein YcfA (HicA-like mRNA interferase family)
MKRVDLIKKITDQGAILVRHGSNHDVYRQPKTGHNEPVPRHSVIKEYLARDIIKNLADTL